MADDQVHPEIANNAVRIELSEMTYLVVSRECTNQYAIEHVSNRAAYNISEGIQEIARFIAGTSLGTINGVTAADLFTMAGVLRLAAEWAHSIDTAEAILKR